MTHIAHHAPFMEPAELCLRRAGNIQHQNVFRAMHAMTCAVNAQGNPICSMIQLLKHHAHRLSAWVKVVLIRLASPAYKTSYCHRFWHICMPLPTSMGSGATFCSIPGLWMSSLLKPQPQVLTVPTCMVCHLQALLPDIRSSQDLLHQAPSVSPACYCCMLLA